MIVASAARMSTTTTANGRFTCSAAELGAASLREPG
jgi:hypothetical protein